MPVTWMTDPVPFLVTGWAMVANGALFFLLTLLVIRRRRAEKIVLGDGDNRDMAKRIRAQANAADQMPTFLIALGLAEANGANGGWLTAVAVAFTLGRMAHAVYFTRPGTTWRLRFWGMTVTLEAQGAILATLALRLLD